MGQRINVIDLHPWGPTIMDNIEMPLSAGPARFRGLVMGPDGSLYAAVDEGQIHRFTAE